MGRVRLVLVELVGTESDWLRLSWGDLDKGRREGKAERPRDRQRERPTDIERRKPEERKSGRDQRRVGEQEISRAREIERPVFRERQVERSADGHDGGP